ncbi:MAG: hypothetical protein WCD53_13210 [Microcoleus sp.]
MLRTNFSVVVRADMVSRRKKELGRRKKEEEKWKSRNGSRKNSHTASFLATCILRLIRWIYRSEFSDRLWGAGLYSVFQVYEVGDQAIVSLGRG